MAQVTDTLTRQIAKLARLELSDEEVRRFTPQLGGIVGYMDQLSRVDVAGVEPLFNPTALLDDLATPLREDEARPFATDADGKPRVLACAPDVLHDGFKVPPIL